MFSYEFSVFVSFAHFLITVFIFFLLITNNSLYIKNINALPFSATKFFLYGMYLYPIYDLHFCLLLVEGLE